MKKLLLIGALLVTGFSLKAQQDNNPLYFCTAADTEHFPLLVNLIGSIHNTNFEHTAEIAIFNLGFTQQEVDQLNKMEKVKVYDIEMTHPDLLQKFASRPNNEKPVRGWYAWKPVAIKQALDRFPYVLWLDAGHTVLKPLDDLFKHIQQNGYFLYGGGRKIRDYTTRTIAQNLDVYQEGTCPILDQEQIESGIQGICKSHTIAYEKYLLAAYEMSKDLHKYFSDDGSAPKGFGMARHDQSVASILARLCGMEVQRGYCNPNYIKLHIDNEEAPFSINANWPLGIAPSPDTAIFVHAMGSLHCERYIIYKQDQEPAKIQEKEIIIIIPSYNNIEYYEYNLESVFLQNYDNYRVIYIDDDSLDGTGDLVESYIKEQNQNHRVTLIKNKKRCGALANIYNAIHSCNDTALIVTLDGDDWFAHENVLTTLNDYYSHNDIWMTYGQFKFYPCGSASPYHELPKWIVDTHAYREHPWTTTHLRTFYSWLFKRVERDDFLCNGKFFSVAWDMAFMFPMLEMSGHRSKFIPEVLYIYNVANPINDQNIHKKEQQVTGWYIRKLPKYDLLQSAPEDINKPS